MEKKCTVCGEVKALEDYYLKSNKRPFSGCKVCQRRLRVEKYHAEQITLGKRKPEPVKLEVSKEQENYYEERRRYYLDKYGPESEYYLRRFGNGKVFRKIKFKWDIFSR